MQIRLLYSGQYDQNLCNKTDISCEKCPRRLPSCIGLSDGKHAYPTRLWKPDYIVCYKNRTVKISRCMDGYFHPNLNYCSKDVARSKFQYGPFIVVLCYLYVDYFSCADVACHCLFLISSTFVLWCLIKAALCECGLPCINVLIQSNNGSNTDGSFTMANSNSFLGPYKILPTETENRCSWKFSYFIIKFNVECTH